MAPNSTPVVSATFSLWPDSSRPRGQQQVTTAVQCTPQGADVKSSLYRPELDALRFCAFFGVFLFHINHPTDFYIDHGIPRFVAVGIGSLIEGGVFGVDLFFVLSAYLITGLLLREKEVFGTIDVRDFYLRRILRIWPVYFFCIALGLIPIFNPDNVFTWQRAVAFVLLAGNWSVVAWGWPIHSIVTQLWTVSIEEQFYLLWPPIVRNLSRRRIAIAAVCMLVISNIARVVIVALHGGMNSVWCNTITRLDPIASGILIAVILHDGIPGFRLRTRVAILIAGSAALALVANNWRIHEPEHLLWVPTLIGFPVVALSCTGILLAVLGFPFRPPSTVLYLGKISYGLYVYESLGNRLSNLLIPVHTGFAQLALRPITTLIFTLIAAMISYTLLEKPFLKLKTRFTRISSRAI